MSGFGFKLLSLLICLCIAGIPLHGVGYANRTPSFQTLEFLLPPGSQISVLMQETISTESAVLGQPVSTVISQDLYMNEYKVLSRNDRIFGKITDIQPPKEGRNAILRIDFDLLLTSNGLKIPISVLVETGRQDHAFGGELTPGTEPEIIPYKVYRIGTYGRVMYHGPREMGKHVVLKPGTRLILVPQKPIPLYAVSDEIAEGPPPFPDEPVSESPYIAPPPPPPPQTEWVRALW